MDYPFIMVLVPAQDLVLYMLIMAWLEQALLLVCQIFLLNLHYQAPKDDRVDDTKETDSISCIVSRRDMATQMSPDDSTHSSPEGRRTSISGESQENGVRNTKERLTRCSDSNLHWDDADARRSMPKLQREEARITAWENLQKAKAEAAIQNELRLSQLKAQKDERVHSQKVIQNFKKALSFSEESPLSAVAFTFLEVAQLGSIYDSRHSLEYISFLVMKGVIS
ncbi:hypothetical protein HAX54_010091 [Datura stramonium]|uniref:Remorin C-terminal domain-containing protein n=1 Tax=Datura stramonium TaxID=4076 RepID=A0ABS8RWS0_DATST|nr:hypothetical protein [Datura stramonium]